MDKKMKFNKEVFGRGNLHIPKCPTVTFEFQITGKVIDLELEFANNSDGEQIGVARHTKEQLVKGILDGKIQIDASSIIMGDAKEKEFVVEITGINTVFPTS